MKTMNFNALTKEKPVNLVTDGNYRARIATAEMKENKNGKYISIRLDILDEEDKRLNGVFDVLSESDAEMMQYKIYRFIRATGIELPENFTLKTILDNIANAKEFKVDITTQKQEGYSPRNVVNVAKDLYYTLDDNIEVEDEVVGAF